MSLASTWSPASGIYAATTDEPATDHERRRELLRESVTRLLAP
ncbi:hypothetical protein [Gryllotalpicola protaetiae]